MKIPFTRATREERETEENIQREPDGSPITCDCPDGPDHPCNGRGCCSSGGK